MFIFVNPGETYIRNGLIWTVESIEQNIVRSSCVDRDIYDAEILKDFNREVVAGLITFPSFSDELYESGTKENDSE